jgi:hypothetical protein
MAQPQPRNATNAEEAREVRLLGLLLVDALETIARGRRGPALRETRQWVCEGDGRDPYSFDRACEAFGLPPVALRRRLGLRAQRTRHTDGRSWIRRPNPSR